MTRRGVCLHEEIGTNLQTIKVRNTQGLDKIPGENGG